MTVGFNRKWLTTAADRDGVGLKTEQFTTRMSICRANTPQVLQCSCAELSSG